MCFVAGVHTLELVHYLEETISQILKYDFVSGKSVDLFGRLDHDAPARLLDTTEAIGPDHFGVVLLLGCLSVRSEHLDFFRTLHWITHVFFLAGTAQLQSQPRGHFQ